jgi:hypothetical protein
LSAMSLVVIMGFLGLAIDVGHLLFVKRSLQKAADAAALAGAIEVRVCGLSPNCPAMQTAAQDAMSENGMTADTVLTNCSGSSGTGVTLMVNNPSCFDAGDPNTGKPNYVEAVASQTVPTFFAWVAGMPSVNLHARAEAVRGVGGPCIWALDPTGPAITILGGVIVQSRCGVVDESTSSDALSCAVGAFLYAPSINVSGGASSLLCLAASTPNTYVAAPNPRDPLAYLPAPDDGTTPCGSSTGSPYYGSASPVNVILGATVTFYPGVYCGGISITASLASTITFEPGMYIMRDGTGPLGITQGGLNINLNALTSISGDGVTFYNEGPTGSFTMTEPVTGGSLVSLGNIDLSAPTSGEFGGVLFDQAQGVSSTGTFLANLLEPSQLEGAIYLPSGPVVYGVSAGSSAYNILVAKDINLTVAVASTFGNDYSTLESGSPLDGDNVSLVE